MVARRARARAHGHARTGTRAHTYVRTQRKILGDIDFNFYYRWFDVIFLMTAWATIGIGLVQIRLNKRSAGTSSSASSSSSSSSLLGGGGGGDDDDAQDDGTV